MGGGGADCCGWYCCWSSCFLFCSGLSLLRLRVYMPLLSMSRESLGARFSWEPFLAAFLPPDCSKTGHFSVSRLICRGRRGRGWISRSKVHLFAFSCRYVMLLNYTDHIGTNNSSIPRTILTFTHAQ